MKTVTLGLLAAFCYGASIYGETFSGADPSSQVTDPGTRAHVAEAYGKLPMIFEANAGQTDARVKFVARGAGYTLFLTPTESVFVLSQKAGVPPADGAEHAIAARTAARSEQPAVIGVRLVGSNGRASIESEGELAGKVNYFIGGDPSQWRTDIPTSERVHYKGVYPGVDMVYYGNQRQLEYDFIVSPNADYEQIKLEFKGAKRVEIEKASGDLLLHTGFGVMREHQPMVYQEKDGERKQIAGRFVRRGKGIGFEVAEYDTTRPLVIDPTLVYSTYLGGSGNDYGYAITVDSTGNAYVAGTTFSATFPLKNPLQATFNRYSDAFVTKLSADGQSLVYSTYLGSTDGAGCFGYAVAVDSSGSAYVTGYTVSTQFPTKNAFQPNFGGGSLGDGDAFVTKLSADGQSLVYSTYLGGLDGDIGNGIAVDSSGVAYVTGSTKSNADFPLKNNSQGFGGGFYDAFVTALAADGQSLIYSTYLGGRGDEAGNGIAVNSSGNAYVTGQTNGGRDPNNFPTMNAFQPSPGGRPDAFVSIINTKSAGTPSLVYSTYLGGSGANYGFSIAVDSAGSAYVTGSTSSTDFPTKNALQPTFNGGDNDAFLSKFSPDGSSLVYSTYLGGNGNDNLAHVAVDSSGSAYISGDTNSTNFPTKNPLQASLAGVYDPFLTKLNPDGQSLIYSTYLGGSGDEFCYGVALDGSGNAYIVGDTVSSDFPTRNAFQANRSGGFDAFVAKIADATPAPAATAQLQNIATRLNVLTGDNVLIGGFIPTGSAPKKVVIRGIGPSLAAFGITNSLADPVLELHGPDGATLATNDNWKSDPTQAAQIQASGLAPKDDLEAALIATLDPGKGYTAIVKGNGGGTGIGLAEVYDIDPAAPSKLGNIATRGFVDAGNNVMIGGFIVGPASGSSTKVVVRGIGPSLTAAGVNEALQDPTLELHDGNGTTIASNDNWQSDVNAAQVQAANLAPKDPRESAIYAVLAPAAYTAILRGKDDTTGVGLVEVYNVP